MAAHIAVTQTGSGDPLEFDVTVKESGSQTRHRVTMQQSTYEQLTGGRVDPTVCVRAAFVFLLDHEPKESILSRFDVTVISRYFPQFERDLPGYLASA
jgi:chorismate synthase